MLAADENVVSPGSWICPKETVSTALKTLSRTNEYNIILDMITIIPYKNTLGGAIANIKKSQLTDCML